MSCCPPDSAPYFSDEYTCKGQESSFSNGLEYYGVGNKTAGGKVIVLIPDIWGWSGGRTRRIADLLTASFDYVIVPKLQTPAFEGGTHGDALPPDFDISGPRAGEAFGWLAGLVWEGNLKPKMEAVFDFIKTTGFSKIGMLGFCWGGWVVCQSAKIADISAAAIPHPSITVEEGLHKGSIPELMSKITFPMLLLPAGGDPDTYRTGGEVLEIIKKNNPASTFEDYPEMSHGFASRGDLSNPLVQRDVTKAIASIQKFLTTHMA